MFQWEEREVQRLVHRVERAEHDLHVEKALNLTLMIRLLSALERCGGNDEESMAEREDLYRTLEEAGKMVIFTDLIQCPQCGQTVEADVTWEEGDLFESYVTTCPTCKYIILESEWDSLNEDVRMNRELLGLEGKYMKDQGIYKWTPLSEFSEFCPCTDDDCVVQLHVEENGTILALEDDRQGARLSFVLGDDWRLCRKGE